MYMSRDVLNTRVTLGSSFWHPAMSGWPTLCSADDFTLYSASPAATRWLARTTVLIGSRVSSRLRFGMASEVWYVPMRPISASRARNLANVGDWVAGRTRSVLIRHQIAVTLRRVMSALQPWRLLIASVARLQ